MKRHLDRYFELFPLLIVILILVAAEHRRDRAVAPVSFNTPGFDYSFPSVDMQIPRVIVR